MHNTLTEYKQMHNKTISWNDNWILIFICFVGRLLLEPPASSSSSFIIALFLIQKLMWIRISSRVEFFIFLIDWGIFFWMAISWSSIAPLFSSLLMIQASSSSQSFLKVITSFWNTFLEWIPRSWEAIQGGHHHFYIFHFFFYRFKLFLIWETLMTAWSLHSRSSHSSTGFFRSYFDFCSSLQIAWNSGRPSTALLAIGSAL